MIYRTLCTDDLVLHGHTIHDLQVLFYPSPLSYISDSCKSSLSSDAEFLHVEQDFVYFSTCKNHLFMHLCFVWIICPILYQAAQILHWSLGCDFNGCFLILWIFRLIFILNRAAHISHTWSSVFKSWMYLTWLVSKSFDLKLKSIR